MNKYDWKKIRKECKRLKIFDGYYNPSSLQWERAKWFVLLSVRSNYKTTNMILLGMVLNKMYGTRIEYARLAREDLTPKRHGHFFDTIKQLGYIEKITNGEYNDCIYKAGFWYFCYVNLDEMKMEKISDDPFMHCFALSQSTEMKSNYTSPSGDFLILDEFIDITKIYRDDFIMLCDCMSTIFRERNDCYVVLLANTIDSRSIWFKELNITQEVNRMVTGEKKFIEKPNQTTVYVELMTPNITETKKKNIIDFFNFNNEKLNAITGNQGGWAVKTYPRLPRCKNEYIARNLYINCDGFYIRVDLLNNENVGICCNVVEVSEYDLHEDSIILTNSVPVGRSEFYGLPKIKIVDIMLKLYQLNKIFFSTTSSAITFENYLSKFNVGLIKR